MGFLCLSTCGIFCLNWDHSFVKGFSYFGIAIALLRIQHTGDCILCTYNEDKGYKKYICNVLTCQNEQIYMNHLKQFQDSQCNFQEAFKVQEYVYKTLTFLV